MGISFHQYVTPASKKAIKKILLDETNMILGGDVAAIVYAAISKSSLSRVFVKHGIHTDFMTQKKAVDGNYFVPFWFDVTVDIDGTKMYGGKTLHVYVGKYMLSGDKFGNSYWLQLPIKGDAHKSYDPEPSSYDKNHLTMWSFTGLVTSMPPGRMRQYGGTKEKKNNKRKRLFKKIKKDHPCLIQSGGALGDFKLDKNKYYIKYKKMISQKGGASSSTKSKKFKVPKKWL